MVGVVLTPSTKAIWPWVIASPFVMVLCHYLAIAPVGTSLLLNIELVISLALLAAVLAIPVLLFFLVGKRYRRAAASWILVCLVFILLAMVGVLGGEVIRRNAFENLATRSEPLVKAIHAFADQHGSPPESLDALVPEYLDAIPGTGMAAYPDFQYEVGKEAERFEGNSWVLRVFAPSGGINFDQFMYFPLQNYPERGHGGWFERVDDWVYLHE